MIRGWTLAKLKTEFTSSGCWGGIRNFAQGKLEPRWQNQHTFLPSDRHVPLGPMILIGLQKITKLEKLWSSERDFSNFVQNLTGYFVMQMHTAQNHDLTHVTLASGRPSLTLAYRWPISRTAVYGWLSAVGMRSSSRKFVTELAELTSQNFGIICISKYREFSCLSFFCN